MSKIFAGDEVMYFLLFDKTGFPWFYFYNLYIVKLDRD